MSLAPWMEPTIVNIITDILIEEGCTINRPAVQKLAAYMINREISLVDSLDRRINSDVGSLRFQLKGELNRVDRPETERELPASEQHEEESKEEVKER